MLKNIYSGHKSLIRYMICKMFCTPFIKTKRTPTLMKIQLANCVVMGYNIVMTIIKQLKM